MSDRPVSMFLAGDALLVTPWSASQDPRTLAVFGLMRRADVTIVNLETVIRSDRGYAQADCGGIWMTSPPEIAHELAWAGVDMVAHANNHAFDYGSGGILETIEHIEAAGIAISGSGSDLQRAREPKYVSFGGVTVGHVSMAATYIPYGKASRTRSDIRGRPGINPLTAERVETVTIPESWFREMEELDRSQGRDTSSYRSGWFMRRGMLFRPGETFATGPLRRLKQPDAKANLEAIAAASREADFVVASIHSHDQSPWLREFSHAAIEASADVVLIHGPHEVRGIEVHQRRPIFYCLGDFAYQSAKVRTLPDDAYDFFGLGADATPDDWIKRRHGIAKIRDNPKTYQACAAAVTLSDDGMESATLFPLDLSFTDDGPFAGHPRLADRELGEAIVTEVAERSTEYGTGVVYNDAENVGDIVL